MHLAKFKVLRKIVCPNRSSWMKTLIYAACPPPPRNRDMTQSCNQNLRWKPNKYNTIYTPILFYYYRPKYNSGVWFQKIFKSFVIKYTNIVHPTLACLDTWTSVMLGTCIYFHDLIKIVLQTLAKRKRYLSR